MSKSNNYPKFVIVSCRQRNSGGAVVLHKLCKMLEEAGYDSKIYYTDAFNYSRRNIVQFFKFILKTIRFIIIDTFMVVCTKIIGEKKLINNSKFNGYAYYQVKGCKRKFLPFVDDNTIVVYPEVVCGNFLHAKRVIRWFLYYNNYLDDKSKYDKDDLFICYRRIFNDWNLNPKGLTVHISFFDLDLYRQNNYNERQGICYIVRKGKNRKDLPETYDGPVVDTLSEVEKVEIFNKYKYCYCYDTQTSYADIAALCGCIPLVILENGKKRQDYLKDGENGYGVAYGLEPDEIEYALKTRHKLYEYYDSLELDNIDNFNNFIEICKKKYDDLKF